MHDVIVFVLGMMTGGFLAIGLLSLFMVKDERIQELYLGLV